MATTNTDFIQDIDFNPLDEAVNEKRYTQGSVNTSGIDMNAPIEEPKFTPPPFKKSTPNVDPKDEKKREPVNPEMKNLSKKDTEMAAGAAAKLIIQGYEWIHDLGNKGLQVSEKKLNKLQAEGEINLNAMIDYDYGKKMRAGEFFVEYNNQVKNILTVSDEFKEEVTPVLERVLAKRGIGLTDEQLLMYMFGKDIAAKSIIFFQQKAQLNYMIQSIKEATVAAPVAPAPAPAPAPQPTSEGGYDRPERPAKAERAEPMMAEPEEYTVDSKQKKLPKAPKRRGRPEKTT